MYFKLAMASMVYPNNLHKVQAGSCVGNNNILYGVQPESTCNKCKSSVLCANLSFQNLL
jgi:hypothetical protein